jgi:hypothetical protein
MPIVLHFYSHWFVLQLLTLSGSLSLVIVANALPLLLLLGGCFATVWFIGGCFAAVSFVGGCFAAVSSASSLADALLPRVTWPFTATGALP